MILAEDQCSLSRAMLANEKKEHSNKDQNDQSNYVFIGLSRIVVQSCFDIVLSYRLIPRLDQYLVDSNMLRLLQCIHNTVRHIFRIQNLRTTWLTILLDRLLIR